MDQDIWQKKLGDVKGFYESVDLFVLFDLLGAVDPKFYIYHQPTAHLFKKLSDIEDKLQAKRLISFKSTKYFITRDIGQEIQDDHVPFHAYNVPILHLIPLPFPQCWHKECDNYNTLDKTTIQDLTKIFNVFLTSYLTHNNN
ncbi:hypothetical protein DFA_09433 [Cavenderia fasciculata]|uniref:Peptidase M28 domain-containing protein n=1 Tax=Cavenderia fasciculata TaxID=261658 RepID=F4Q7L7_CACFS|nr:uncharacterized protein DFA_09433 [Cavenderia fasciculata]EGG16399.1 hypothetical protein DFA_09433 [Cavenderia fasciculata]|eukprot:XP_004354783.1 hypothetical protein DFA_09433 [Cavenderia fasciculata]